MTVLNQSLVIECKGPVQGGAEFNWYFGSQKMLGLPPRAGKRYEAFRGRMRMKDSGFYWK